MLKIVTNDDEELVKEAEKQLQLMKEKYRKRYCPCALEFTQDTICPCKNFRDKEEEGECDCGRYKKIKSD